MEKVINFKNYVKPYSAESVARLERMMELRNDGLTNAEIALLMGLNYQTVHNRIGAQRERPRAKVMRELRDCGLTNQGIAKRLGISYPAVVNAIGLQPAWMTEASLQIGAEKRRLNVKRRMLAIQLRAQAVNADIPRKSKNVVKLEAARESVSDLSMKIQEIASLLA